MHWWKPRRFWHLGSERLPASWELLKTTVRLLSHHQRSRTQRYGTIIWLHYFIHISSTGVRGCQHVNNHWAASKVFKKDSVSLKVAGLVLHDKKLMDVLPEPAPALAPPCVQLRASSPKHPQTDSASTENYPTSLGIWLRCILQSTRNSFGLF